MGSKKRARAGSPSGSALKAASSHKVDYEKIRLVAASSQLRDINLSQFSARATRPLSGSDPNSFRQKIAFRAIRVPADAELAIAMIEVKFEVSDEDRSSVAEVEGTWVAVYDLSSEFPDDAIEAFAEVNGLYHAWPYIRELVSGCASRLGLSGIVLPIWRPPEEFPAKGQFHEMSFTPAFMVSGEESASNLHRG